MDHKEFLKDGGYKSRKFWLCIITMALMVAASHICPAAALPEVIMGVGTVFTVYLGGNTVNRWNSGKIVAQAINQQSPQPDPKQEEGS
jgi:hypothetical protein